MGNPEVTYNLFVNIVTNIYYYWKSSGKHRILGFVDNSDLTYVILYLSYCFYDFYPFRIKNTPNQIIIIEIKMK
jgi:hypothetical protein